MGRLAKMRWIAVGLLLLAGCRSNDVEVKPVKKPEEFTMPPAEARFSQNIEYPKETLFTDVIKKDSQAPTNPASNPNRMGPGAMGARGGY